MFEPSTILSGHIFRNSEGELYNSHGWVLKMLTHLEKCNNLRLGLGNFLAIELYTSSLSSEASQNIWHVLTRSPVYVKLSIYSEECFKQAIAMMKMA